MGFFHLLFLFVAGWWGGPFFCLGFCGGGKKSSGAGLGKGWAGGGSSLVSVWEGRGRWLPRRRTQLRVTSQEKRSFRE